VITDAVLKVGLAALALVTHAKLDVETVQIWRYALRGLTEDQFRFGVDAVVRTWKYPTMPPPAVVLEAAYTAPPPPPRSHPIRENGHQLWISEEQERHVEQIVRDHPRAADESAVEYAVRIATLAGLLNAAPKETESHE
jgi:hypothetical protein